MANWNNAFIFLLFQRSYSVSCLVEYSINMFTDIYTHNISIFSSFCLRSSINMLLNQASWLKHSTSWHNVLFWGTLIMAFKLFLNISCSRSPFLSYLSCVCCFFVIISRFTLNAVDSRGSHSESSFVSVRTSCPMVDDSRAEGILPLTVPFFISNYLIFYFHLLNCILYENNFNSVFLQVTPKF